MIKLEGIDFYFPRKVFLEACWSCKRRTDCYCTWTNEKLEDFRIREFICDGYIRNNSGNFRRKIKKFKKGEPVTVKGFKGVF